MRGKEPRWGEETEVIKIRNIIFPIKSRTLTVQYIFYSIDIIYTKKVFQVWKA